MERTTGSFSLDAHYKYQFIIGQGTFSSLFGILNIMHDTNITFLLPFTEFHKESQFCVYCTNLSRPQIDWADSQLISWWENVDLHVRVHRLMHADFLSQVYNCTGTKITLLVWGATGPHFTSDWLNLTKSMRFSGALFCFPGLCWGFFFLGGGFIGGWNCPDPPCTFPLVYMYEQCTEWKTQRPMILEIQYILILGRLLLWN